MKFKLHLGLSTQETGTASRAERTGGDVPSRSRRPHMYDLEENESEINLEPLEAGKSHDTTRSGSKVFGDGIYQREFEDGMRISDDNIVINKGPEAKTTFSI